MMIDKMKFVNKTDEMLKAIVNQGYYLIPTNGFYKLEATTTIGSSSNKMIYVVMPKVAFTTPLKLPVSANNRPKIAAYPDSNNIVVLINDAKERMNADEITAIRLKIRRDVKS